MTFDKSASASNIQFSENQSAGFWVMGQHIRTIRLFNYLKIRVCNGTEYVFNFSHSFI
jgi:hypothetical protein